MRELYVRSEGQRLLLAVPKSLAEIADAVGTRSRMTVLYWRNGKKIPGTEMRGLLFGEFGIPPLAWSQPAGGNPSRPGAEPPPDISNAGPPPTTLDSCLQLLAKIHAESNKVLLPSERVKLADTEARILALRHKLELQAELTEDRIIREHPQWQRVKRAILAALVPFPQASKAVCDALANVGNM